MIATRLARLLILSTLWRGSLLFIGVSAPTPGRIDLMGGGNEASDA